jgi:hypothetical protein
MNIRFIYVFFFSLVLNTVFALDSVERANKFSAQDSIPLKKLHPIQWFYEEQDGIFYMGDVRLKKGVDTVFFERLLFFSFEGERFQKDESIIQKAKDLSIVINTECDGCPMMPYFDPLLTSAGLVVSHPRGQGFRLLPVDIFLPFLDIDYWK